MFAIPEVSRGHQSRPCMSSPTDVIGRL